MKNTSLGKKPAAGVLPKQKNQRVEQKTTSVQTLNNSELHYRGLLENMLTAFTYCRMIFEQGQPQDFVYLDVNSAFESLTGLKDVAGKKASEVIPGIKKSDPQLIEIYGRVALSGKPERFEIYVAALKMWFSISVYSPERGCFAAVFDAITERQPDGKYFKRLVDAMPYSIAVINPVGEIILVNSQTEKLFGYSRNEILGKRLEFLVPRRYESRHRIHRLNYFETPHSRQIGAGLELFGLARDGREFPVDVSLSPFQTEEVNWS